MVIDRGSLWRVGDGKSINVWREKWSKKPPEFIAQKPEVPTPFKVEKLIAAERREWDMEMVKQVLVEDDAARGKITFE